MPSDATMVTTEGLAQRALEALHSRIAAFRTVVAEAERTVREEVERRRSAEGSESHRVLGELGPFAVGRIDPERFSRLLGAGDTALTPEAVDVLDWADAILRGLGTSDETYRVRVEPGGDVRDVVKQALAGLGRVYGAARAVELARSGVFEEEAHDHLLGAFPFRLWNRAERRLAPPLVVELQGTDCLPVGLGDFLDGDLVLVLVVSGPTTPAPLARLITPGTFVMQTTDPEELGRLAESDHPGIALVFDEDRPEQARFVHDPEAGDTPWERLTVGRMPSEGDVGRGRRAPAWLEELAHLRSLARSPVGAGGAHGPAAAGEAPAGEAPAGEVPAPGASRAGAPGLHGSSENGAHTLPADRLAAWLLARTDTDEAREDL